MVNPVFHSQQSLSATIAKNADAPLVKAVLGASGSGNKASITDHGALQVTPPPEGKTAFGEMSVAEPTPVIALSFPYSVNPGIVEIRNNNSGTTTHANRQAVLSTGAATNSSAWLQSRGILRYAPGIGALARWTSIFTAGVAGSSQISGIGTESDGFGFGYNGATFGIIHRRDGSPEIRTLTITTGSSHAENITITLDGDAKTDVAVTNTGNVTLTANEIAAADYSDVGRGWDAYAVGDTVEFISWSAAVRTGAYSLSSATSAVGTFAQTVAGAAPTDTWVAQADWNGVDIFDGNGITGVTLDPTKGNVYQVKFQWLGYGAIQFAIEDPDDGEMHLVHTIEYANANTTPSLGDPSMRMGALVENTTNTTDIVIKTGSMAAFYEGKNRLTGPRFGAGGTKTSITTTALPVLSIRLGTNFSGLRVKTLAKLLRLFYAVEHNKPMVIEAFANGTLTGANWSTAVNGVTATQFDTTASAISGGTQLASIPVGQKSSGFISFDEANDSAVLRPGDVFTLTARATSGTGAEADVGINAVEYI